MNTVTLVLYLISVLGSLRGFAGILLLLLAGDMLAALVFANVKADHHNLGVPIKDEISFAKFFRPLIVNKFFIVSVVVCTGIIVLIPKTRTMHMMAASEVSQMAIESETGQRLLGKVEAIIDGYLEGD